MAYYSVPQGNVLGRVSGKNTSMNPPTTSIRLAKFAEIKDIVRLIKLHTEYEQATYVENGQVQKLERLLFADNPTVFCLVALVNERIIGYATYMPQFSTWEAENYVYMDCLYLEEAARGLGLGRKLVERIQQESLKMGCNLVQWQTPDFNVNAIQFYDKIGAVGKSKQRYSLYAT